MQVNPTPFFITQQERNKGNSGREIQKAIYAIVVQEAIKIEQTLTTFQTHFDMAMGNIGEFLDISLV